MASDKGRWPGSKGPQKLDLLRAFKGLARQRGFSVVRQYAWKDVNGVVHGLKLSPHRFDAAYNLCFVFYVPRFMGDHGSASTFDGYIGVPISGESPEILYSALDTDSSLDLESRQATLDEAFKTKFEPVAERLCNLEETLRFVMDADSWKQSGVIVFPRAVAFVESLLRDGG